MPEGNRCVLRECRRGGALCRDPAPQCRCARAGVDRTPQLLLTALRQRVKIQGFIIFDHYRRMGAFQQDMQAWLREGRVRYREELIDGLENAPRGLMGM